MFKRSKYYIPAIICSLIILYLSAFPGPQIDFEFQFLHLDKVGHLAAYFVLTALIGWGYFKVNQQFLIKTFLTILIIGSVYGFMMECMQYLFFPNRYFEYEDMLANSIGSFLGLLSIKYLYYYHFNIK